MKKRIILSLGGSIIVPDQIDVDFLRDFKQLVLKHLDDYDQWIIVTGGGKTARRYQNAADEVNSPEPEDLDWLGIHATRLNGHLMRTIFKNYADPEMITDPAKMTERDAKMLIMAGYRPGNSTDYIATLAAEAYKADLVVNLSNIAYVYDKDPKQYPDAKIQKELNWEQMKALIGDNYTPGMNTPFDPKATQLAASLGLEVVFLKGTDLANFEAFLEGKGFEGSLVR